MFFDIEQDCAAADLRNELIPGYRPPSGLGYYEFKEPEYISPNSQVLIIDKVWDHKIN